ncbi:HNH endonuclease, partial [Campylobacter jejuni]|nr:HNH endonuclease [Campylobacter jejuni]EHY7172321.1 HNH endonuclease [Campylobacter jejuni]
KVHKLGNYILLEKKYNQELKDKKFEEKISIYNKSSFKLPRYIADNFKTWDTKSIDQYQNFLAKQALALWKIQ